jgi:hypothetical protein
LVLRLLFSLIYQPRMIDDGKRGAIGAKICKANRRSLRKSAQASLCSPQIPHDLTRPSTVGIQRQQPELWHAIRFDLAVARETGHESL